jgi:hypothetical protein
MDDLSVKTCKKTRKFCFFPGLFSIFDTQETSKLVQDQQIENQLFLQKPQNTREKYTRFPTIFENRGFLFYLKKRNFQVHSVRYTKTKTLVVTKSFYNLCACLKVAQKLFWNLSKKCEGFFKK